MKDTIYQSLRFATVGLINTAIGLATIYALMFFFDIGLAIANAVGYAIGLSISFVLNRVWTFKSSQSIANVLRRYLVVVIICYLLNLVAVVTGASYFFANPYIAQLLGVGIYTVCMFFGCRQFVFAKQHATPRSLKVPF